MRPDYRVGKSQLILQMLKISIRKITKYAMKQEIMTHLNEQLNLQKLNLEETEIHELPENVKLPW